MSNGLKAAAVAVVLAWAGGMAWANTVFSSPVGDKDGFGINATTPGQTFFLSDIFDNGSPDGDGTDEVIDTTSVNHLTPFTGNVISAKLTLFHAGWGAYGPAKVLLNGHEISYLLNGESGNNNIALEQPFDLVGHLDLLTGDDWVTILSVPLLNGSGDVVVFDDGILDYSLLSITTDAGGTTPLPEPTSWALVALALAGLAASRRRQAR